MEPVAITRSAIVSPCAKATPSIDAPEHAAVVPINTNMATAMNSAAHGRTRLSKTYSMLHGEGWNEDSLRFLFTAEAWLCEMVPL